MKNNLVPEPVAESFSVYRNLLEEQAKHAVVIPIKPWFHEQALLTIADYAGEPEPDDCLISGVAAFVGDRPPEVQPVVPRQVPEPSSPAPVIVEPRRIQVTSWLDYLQQVAYRRKGCHILWPQDTSESIGFMDGTSLETVSVSMTDVRESRRAIKKDKDLTAKVGAVAEQLGLADVKAALAASRSPASRGALLGPSIFNDHPPPDAPLPVLPVEVELTSLWETDTPGSFSKTAAELDTFQVDGSGDLVDK